MNIEELLRQQEELDPELAEYIVDSGFIGPWLTAMAVASPR